MLEASDFGLVELDAAPFPGFFDAKFANDTNGFLAGGDTGDTQLVEGALGGIASRIHVVVDAEASGGSRKSRRGDSLRAGSGVLLGAESGKNFADNLGDNFLVERGHFYLVW